MSKAKFYNSEQAFKICCSFFLEIYENCSKIYNNRLKADVKYPILQSYFLSVEQFNRLEMFASEMNWHPDWNIEWQESIVRLEFCTTIGEIEALRFLRQEILIIAYEMLTFKVVYWNFDFVPVLAVIKKILQQDKGFEVAIDIWEEKLALFQKDSSHPDLNFFAYSSDITDSMHYSRKKVAHISEYQRDDIEKRVRDYLSKIGP